MSLNKQMGKVIIITNWNDGQIDRKSISSIGVDNE